VDDERDEWREGVDRTILATLASVAAAMVPVGAASHDITQAIADAAEGGKRMRSIMLLASHHAHDGHAPRAAITLGAALELFHMGALLHDDILDDSDTRRGRPSAHHRFASHHRDRGWEGDSLVFGRAGALLAGDVALMAADRALHAATSALSGAPRDRVAFLFHDTVDLVIAGQYLDMRIATQPLDELAGQEADIRATMRAKTAAYTGEAPLTLGAASAGMDDARIEAIRQAGVPLGLAFQLRDDILGLCGDPTITGKPSGGDVREGKRTLLMWHAWTHANANQRSTLRRALGVRAAPDADVAAAIAVAREVGAFEAVEREIDESARLAQERIAGLGLMEPYASMLVGIAANAADRDR
jgi:geranylgeranyl diphosphate synthase type I